MRKELFTDICDALHGIDGDYQIKHLDMWNRNVEYLDQEQPWDMPAVFVEFDPITWQKDARERQKCKAVVKLHVVTRWEGDASLGSSYRGAALSVFTLLRHILVALDGLNGASFHNLQRVGSITNHNHEDILENIEVYDCIGFDFINDTNEF